MELHSELIHYLDFINKEPALVMAWAAFGVPLLMALLAIPFGFLRKIGIPKTDSAYGFICIILFFCWMIGFLSQMAFLFLGISGLKMLLLWVIMFFVYAVFVTLNYGYIRKWIDKNTKEKT